MTDSHDVAYASVGYQLQIWPGPWLTSPVLWITQPVVYLDKDVADAECGRLQAVYNERAGGMSVVQVVCVTIDSSLPEDPLDFEDDNGG